MMTQMKKSVIALAVASAFWGATAVADNESTSTATVNGKVIAGLVLAKTTNLTMPTIVLPLDATDNSVVFTCANDGTKSYVYSTGATPFAAGLNTETGVNSSTNNEASALGSSGVCAEFTLTGENSYNYKLAVSITDVSGTDVVLSDPTCAGSAATAGANTSNVFSSASETIFCGAKVTVTKDAVDYTGITGAGEITLVAIYD